MAGEAVFRGGMGEGEDEIVKNVGVDPDGEYFRYRRRQRIHRLHLVGYVIFVALVLIGMMIFWR